MAVKEKQDNGLGLGGFLGGSPKKEAAPKEKVASLETEPEKKEEKKVTLDLKPEEKKEVSEKKEAVKEEKKDVSEKEKGEKEKVKVVEEVKAEVKPVSDFESEDNPWKKKAISLEKRQNDTAAWANKLNQANIDLKKQMDVLGKKIDGTYDPEKDNVSTESSAELREREAEVRGKVAASEAAATAQYGEETVTSTLVKFNEVYGQDREKQFRVLNSHAPVLEALKIMREHDFHTKYGPDPEKIVESIRAEVEKELRPKITEEVTKTFMDRMDKKNKEPKGLTDVKGSDHQEEKKKTGFKTLDGIMEAIH
jgi:hypothetical protein